MLDLQPRRQQGQQLRLPPRLRLLHCRSLDPFSKCAPGTISGPLRRTTDMYKQHPRLMVPHWCTRKPWENLNKCIVPMHTAYGYAHALIESCVRIQMFGTRESTKGLALVIVRHPPHARKTKIGAVFPFSNNQKPILWSFP